MTPFTYSKNSPSVFIIFSSGNCTGSIFREFTNRDLVIRPVLSLKSCVKWISGNGAWNTPYEVSIDSTCIDREN